MTFRYEPDELRYLLLDWPPRERDPSAFVSFHMSCGFAVT
jgi:hypothetical protein